MVLSLKHNLKSTNRMKQITLYNLMQKN